MRINDSSNQHQSLYHDALRWAGATSTEYPFDPDFVRDANFALDLVSAAIMRFDGTWEWDDPNHTNGDGDPELPIATADLESGRDNYPLSLTHLKILRVRVKNTSGDWVTLKPKQRRELTDDQLAATGTPSWYDKLGARIYLGAIPNYSVTGGIEMQHQRSADYFATNDTTKEPGFAPHLHRLISLLSALDQAEKMGRIEKATLIRNRLGMLPENRRPGTGLWNELALHYSQRDYDEEPKMQLAKSNRGIALL